MDELMNTIREKGFRFTTQKKEVLSQLQKKPQSVLAIFKQLQSKKCSVDKATVYRILSHFVRIGIVREINLNNREALFELDSCDHHHHLVCEKCGEIEDVALKEEPLLSAVKKQSTFQIKRHSLEFFGLCKKCQ